MTDLITARSTLDHVAALVERSLSPEARASATAATLRQIGEIGGDAFVTPGILSRAMNILASGRDTDTPPISSRRRTCGEIADLIGHDPMSAPDRMVPVLRAVAIALSGTSDPRQAAIAATVSREADEIEAWRAAKAANINATRKPEGQMDALQRMVDDDRRNNDNH
jgi:hypothetical protein